MRVQGEADRRIPVYQGLEFFQSLAAQGKTVGMVTYPGATHIPVLWEQKLNIIHEIEAWLARYNS
jgi:dipeptidyl aminopeptidase/acylaminoacyl peptidase